MVSSQIAPAGLFSGSRTNRSLSSAQSLLSSLDTTQSSSALPGFRDLLTYFLKLEEMARQLAKQQVTQADLSNLGLLSANLHLNIRVEGFTNLSAADAGGSQSVESQSYSTNDGVATRVTLRTPQIQADGTVSYNVTVLKLAISTESLSPRLDLAQSASLGQPQIAAAAGSSSSGGLADFMGESGFAGGPGTLLWEYDADNVQISDNSIAQQKMSQELYAMANALMEFLNQQQIMHAFDMNAQEQKRIEDLVKDQAIAAEKAAIIDDIKNKQITMQLVIKDTIKRHRQIEEAGGQNAAKALHHRLLQFLGTAAKQLDQANIEPSEFAGLLEDFQHLDLQMKAALAAQTTVPTSSTH